MGKWLPFQDGRLPLPACGFSHLPQKANAELVGASPQKPYFNKHLFVGKAITDAIAPSGDELCLAQDS